MKVIQDVLGHADIGTTMNIYTDATQDLKNREFESFSDYLKRQEQKNEKGSMVVDVITIGR